MTVLLIRLSGTYLKAGVTEKQEGLPLLHDHTSSAHN